ncbi:MAG: rubrerythrin [Proteobacteria bacterium]|nr:rubrerythrin [Pseudomonadota bacterium]
MDEQEIKRVFKQAIKREIEANSFYYAASTRIKDRDLHNIFMKLAREEHGHMEMLERFYEDPSLPFKVSKPETDYRLAEQLELPELSCDMKPEDAIALAIKKEQLAMETYQHMAALCTDRELQDIFQNLANMEAAHKQRLEKMFINVSLPESF